MPREVRLKPMLGLEPKSWLTAIYGLLVFGLVFWILFGQGITAPGTSLTVLSTPAGAAIEWNGKVVGSTPLTVFLPQGTAELVVRRPGFVPSIHSYRSDGSLLKSLVFRHQETLDIHLVPRSSTSILETAAQNIGAWGMSVPADEDHPSPPLFVPMVGDLEASGASQTEIRSALRSLRFLVVGHELYVDYGRAWGLWDDQPPVSLQKQAALWDGVLNPGLKSNLRGFWLLACQPAGVQARILASGDAEFEALRDAWRTATATQPEEPELAPPPPVVTSMGLFRGIAGGWSYWGQTASKATLPTQDPWRISVLTRTARFWLAESEVTTSQLNPFFVSHPEWKPLHGTLSWSGAMAFVDWLNTQSGRPEGLIYALPTQQEWEVAMRLNPTLWASVRGRWEWTSSPWGAADYLVGGDGDPDLPVPSFARTAKGGSNFWGRAGLAVTVASPSLGLRLALKPLKVESSP